MVIVIILILVVIGVCWLMSATDTKPEEQPRRSEPNRTAAATPVKSKNKTGVFRIAGISRRCGKSDVGVIIGEAVREPNNPHDKFAIAVIANSGQKDEKLLGYISKNDQYFFDRLAGKADALPFVGFIEEFENESGRMTTYSRIKIFGGNDREIEAEMSKTMRQLADIFNINDYDRRVSMLDKFR